MAFLVLYDTLRLHIQDFDDHEAGFILYSFITITNQLFLF